MGVLSIIFDKQIGAGVAGVWLSISEEIGGDRLGFLIWGINGVWSFFWGGGQAVEGLRGRGGKNGWIGGVGRQNMKGFDECIST